MDRRRLGVMLLLLAALTATPPRAAAVSYFPLAHREPGEETLVQAGRKVYLFHSGTEDARRALRVGEVLTVVRVSGTCKPVEVGTVRVLAFVGGTYLEAEVISGAVKPNDIARGGFVSCLVLAAQPCERE